MAPLRTKVNHTLHKINDKFKRQSTRSAQSRDDEDDDAHGKQPRTPPTNGPSLPPVQAAAPLKAIGLSSPDGANVPQLPRMSASGSAMSIGESSAYGFDGSSPASSLSVEFLDQKPVGMQAAVPALGTLADPIGTSFTVSVTLEGRGPPVSSCLWMSVCCSCPTASGTIDGNRRVTLSPVLLNLSLTLV